MSAMLFDRDQVDHLDDLPDNLKGLNGSKLLWVDIDRGEGEKADEVARAFDLDEATRDHLASSSGRAVFDDYGRYIHVTTYSPCDDEDRRPRRARVCRRRELGDHCARSPGLGAG